METELTSRSILGEEGRIAQRLSHYEHRPEQLEMAEAVEQAIAAQTHLVVEAGTGVGKSFAYLVPIILAVTADQGERAPEEGAEGQRRRKRAVIATHTIALQEQLVQRDIPFLNAVLPVEFSTVLVKGRGNYLSLRRLQLAVERAATLFNSPEAMRSLDTIVSWSKETSDGSLASLPERPAPEVWDEVQSDSSNCLGRRCPTHEQCFYFQARRRVWNADLLVANHAMFFSDLAVRQQGGSILPDYDVVVFDEAHTVEAVAADHLGLSISNGQIEYQLNKLFNERSQKGLFAHYQHDIGMRLVMRVRDTLYDYFASLEDYRERHSSANGRLRAPIELPVDLATPLNTLASEIRDFAEDRNDSEKVELHALGDRCVSLASDLTSWEKQSQPDSVYWTEMSGRRRDRIHLYSAPVEVHKALRGQLFQEVKTVVLTSATLAVGGQSFEFVKSRLGADDARELKLGSPFDYRRNARLILPARMPDPSEVAAYETAVCEKIKKYVAQTEGRAFVLFTSFKMLDNVAKRLSSWLYQQQIALFQQGEGVNRSLLLDRFRKHPRGVLFGADSFWQGVDVRGDALQNVIITKLPFSVPDHPLLEARLEAIRNRGGNPFVEYQVPEAAIKFKQGFGRLIRSKTDTGMVVVLDPRLRTKAYGRLFLESLPDIAIEIDE